jgi:hypothetical protein
MFSIADIEMKVVHAVIPDLEALTPALEAQAESLCTTRFCPAAIRAIPLAGAVLSLASPALCTKLCHL